MEELWPMHVVPIASLETGLVQDVGFVLGTGIAREVLTADDGAGTAAADVVELVSVDVRVEVLGPVVMT